MKIHGLNRCKAGFTLIELLVVIAIIGVLASLASLGVSQALDAGHGAACRSNLRSLGLAMEKDFLQGLKVPANLRIARALEYPTHETTPVPRTVLAGFPLLADIPPLPPPPPQPPPPPPAWNKGEGELGRLSCPLATANPVYALDPQHEPASRSYGIRHRALGRSLTQGGWLLAESDLRHIKRTEDLAARHNGRLHVYQIGGGVDRVLPEDIEF